MLPDLRELERRLGYEFRERHLLREALTHGSATRLRGKRRRTNERLEFLGDRVVGLAVADLLIRRYPDESEGTLTSRLSGLVREPALAETARELGLGAWLEVARSEEEAGGRDRPAILADALEALMGAVYLDGGWEAAAAIIRRCGLGLPEYRVTRTSGPAHAPLFEIAASLGDLASATATGGSKRAAEQAAAEELLARLHARSEPT